MFIIVDLPEPEVPTMAINSPRSVRNVTSTKARTVSPVGSVYVLLISRNSIMDTRLHYVFGSPLNFSTVVRHAPHTNLHRCSNQLSVFLCGMNNDMIAHFDVPQGNCAIRLAVLRVDRRRYRLGPSTGCGHRD